MVRLIFELYTEEQLSLYKLAKRLSDMRIPTPTKRPHGQWQAGTVGKIIGNETYAGTWYYGKCQYRKVPKEQWIAVDVPAIVDRGTWEQAQRQRKTNRANSPRRTRYKYLLRRRVICGQCNTRMTCVNREGRKYYRCSIGNGGRVVHSRECTQSKRFRVDCVDAVTWQQIKEWMDAPAKLVEELDAHRRDQERKRPPARTVRGGARPVWQRTKSRWRAYSTCTSLATSQKRCLQNAKTG